MSQYSNNPPPQSPPSPPPPPAQTGPTGGFRPPPPHVIHIAARPASVWQVIGLMLGLVLFAGVFIIGMIFGIAMMAAGASIDEQVVRTTYRDGGRDIVAVIPVEGVIDESQSAFVRAAVDHLLDDDDVKAVVLRVDSPGGGVSASDQIWYEVNRLRAEGLPVIASYGGVAASGGYYVSCGADHIIAEETCITGSIGVIAQVLTLEGLMEKVGVQPVTLVATGSPEKNIANDIFRQWDERDKQKVQIMLDAAYETFTRRVRDGRSTAITDPARIDALANGSIYTAQQALDGGLIDGIGYLDDAVAKAEALGGVATGAAEVIVVRKPPSLFGSGLLGEVRNSLSASATQELDADAIRNIVNDLSSPRVMYLMR